MLNSKYANSLRDNGSTAVFDLPSGGVDLDGSDSVCIVTVESFSALNTIYNIDSNSNQFEYVLYDVSSSASQPTSVVSIDSGGYDIYTLIAALNTALTNILVFTYNDITAKVTITSATTKSAYHYLYVISTRYTTILKKLGFDLTLVSTLTNGEKGFQSTAIAANSYPTLTATNLPNLYYPQLLYVGIDQIHAPNRVALAKSNYGSILSSFVVEGAFGSLLYSRPNMPFEFHIPNLKTNTITLRVFDEDGSPINWNAGNWFAIVGLQYGVNLAEDPHLGRHPWRPILKRTRYDPLETQRDHERNIRNRH